MPAFLSPRFVRASVRAGTRALAISALVASPLLARQSDPMAAMDHHAMRTPLSAKAKEQIARVFQELRPAATTAAAGAEGFHPEFGWIATMGVHWVDATRMSKAVESTLAAPSNLMFSRIDGRDSLVGAAFAYLTQAGDTVPPRLFDGSPPWHQHENLAPPGMTIVMLHVWFVPSPDGPFAGTNPNLPFWAVGLKAPDSSRMHDPAFSARIRRAALALADVTDSASIFPRLGTRGDLQALLKPRRDSVRAVIAELRDAERTADAVAWDRAAARAAELWDGLYQTYVGWARTPDVRQRIERQAAMLMGRHGH